MSRRRRGGGAVLLILALAGLAGLDGCAGAQRRDGTPDPLEPVNRAVYQFNDVLDRAVMKPVADAYVEALPQGLRDAIGNFYDNLSYPNVILNDLLQGKFTQGLADFWRLVLNTAFGFGGFLDVAGPQGLTEHDEDLGQTLGTWGMGEGFYLVLPLFGPSTLRDAPDLAAQTVTSPLYYVNDLTITLPTTAGGFVDKRARASGALRTRDEAAIDPYLFTREAYLQRRTFLIYDGHPPRAPLEEDWDEEPTDDAP